MTIRPKHVRHVARIAGPVVGSAVLALLAVACESAPRESGRPVARTAPNAPPQRVSCLVQCVDSNSNGLQDTILVLAYLFPAPSASALPVHAKGEFRFALAGEDKEPIADWTFPADQVAVRQGSDGIGANHTFTLDLIAATGTDQLPRQMATLSASFIRADGVTVTSSGPVAISLGSR